MTKFEEYVDKVETLINEYTKGLAPDELRAINRSIENSSAGSGKIWLEDFVDKQINKK
jgi:hypothetical protein|tara:strand:+ start:473 stop:646 length:174 start_codon:yes stop_codon:yes gene_type:complete